ncbi:MAG: response regulator transcription factor [Duodenibacillus sp.]|nr:response regulator transcription factor [Duodenibacillus sp.]
MAEQSPLVRVVDDDAEFRESLTFMLECEGYEVAAFASAAEFFAGDRPSRVGCLILDVMMPEVTGLEMQEELVKRGYQSPTIFLTAHGTIDMAVQTMREGACDFQQKPLQPESFLKAVARAVEKDRERRGGARDISEELALYEQLTEREEQICRLVAGGLINKVIGERLGISKRTVDHIRASGLNKLQIKTIAQLAGFFERIDRHKEAAG